MSETQQERELKFDLPEVWELPDTRRVVPAGGTVEVETQRLESTYYDTAGHDLLASRVTLRRRTGDADTGWQLKIPSGIPGDGARQEIRVPLAPQRGVPAELRALTAGLRGPAALRITATLRTERAVRRLVAADGVGLAEIVHDTVTATIKHQFSVIRTWHEVEVELLDGGSEKLLARIAKWLGKHGARPSNSPSKLGRALETSARPGRSTSTAGGVLGAYLDDNLSAIVAGDITLRRDAVAPIDPAELRRVVHATRVATRRYRSTLRVFAPLLDRGRAAALDGELAWFAAALGEVRDRHVLRTTLARALDELDPELMIGPVRRHIDSALDVEETAARADLRTVMNSRRYAALLADLRGWAVDLPVLDATAPASALVPAARKATRMMDRRVDAARAETGRDPAGTAASDVAHHRARKAAKRARYAGELVEPVLGKPARTLIVRAKKRQQRLGDRQDEVVAAQFLLRLGHQPGGNGFTLGVLYRRQRDLAEGVR